MLFFLSSELNGSIVFSLNNTYFIYHGDGPNQSDSLDVCDVWVFKADGNYFMHYYVAGPQCWLCCLATRKDLEHKSAQGFILDFGAKENEDCTSAFYGTTFFDGKKFVNFLDFYKKIARSMIRKENC